MSRKKHIDVAPPGEDVREVAVAEKSGEKAWQAALRPQQLR